MFGDSFFTITTSIMHDPHGAVFVPMFGDSFFTLGAHSLLFTHPECFRPHVWGFFFHPTAWLAVRIFLVPVFVPMFGDSFFTGAYYGYIRKIRILFSSPCLGILFSQQAWDAPRGGLSMALLRRGFPIDWNSHYFHPLTFCFLRFHAHRRGFSK